MNSTKTDLIRRFHPYTHSESECFVSNDAYMAKNCIKEETKIIVNEYDRPYFNAPSLKSEAGNFLVFTGLVEDRLKNLNFNKEKELLTILMNLSFEQLLKIELIDLCAHFVDFENFYKTYEIEEENETVYLLKKNTDRQQLKALYEINKTQTFNKEHLEFNIYNRNALYYINNSEQLEKYILYLKQENINLEQYLFNLDSFNQSPFSHPLNIDVFNCLLKHGYKNNSQLTDMLINGFDNFKISPLGYYSFLLEKQVNKVTSLKNALEILNPVLETYLILNENNSPHAQLIIDSIKTLIKSKKETALSKDIKNQIDIAIEKYILEKSINNITNNENQDKKIIKI